MPDMHMCPTPGWRHGACSLTYIEEVIVHMASGKGRLSSSSQTCFPGPWRQLLVQKAWVAHHSENIFTEGCLAQSREPGEGTFRPKCAPRAKQMGLILEKCLRGRGTLGVRLHKETLKQGL